MDGPSKDMEVYSVPSHSSWFSWNNIHEVERFSLTEFFDGSSITRSPRIYKEYRDFIISKYRENPSRKLTFTEVRKSLVGDICVLLKVFTFLEKWGLINFSMTNNNDKSRHDVRVGPMSSGHEEEEDNWSGKVKVEEGAPHGVRVVAAPNSMKPIIAPPPPPTMIMDGGGSVGEVGESGFKWPPLASYSDVYAELIEEEKKGLLCGTCKEQCDALHYEYTKEGSLLICEKCFKAGDYDEDKSADDFKLKDMAKAGVWTEGETLLLLESVLKHGDDWELVAENVQSKSKQECILKLIEMPLGNLMLGSAHGKGSYLNAISAISNSTQTGLAPNEANTHVKSDDLNAKLSSKDQQNKDLHDEGPPLKKVCYESTSGVESSLMKQVARISTLLGPHVTASAADAAVTALCYGNHCSREIFDDDDDDINNDPKASCGEASDEKRGKGGDDVVEVERTNQSEVHVISSATNMIPLNLRTRAATATALGAAAANAKLLADQEEREISHLLATMIEEQVKKVHRKMKHLEDLELMMETEQAQLEVLEEALVAERLNLLQMIVAAGINKPKELSSIN